MLFAVGAAIERHNHHKEKGGEATPAAQTGSSERGGETGGETGHAETGGIKPASGGETHKESSEDIFGINPEAKGLVAAAVAAGVVLAVAVWFLDAALVLLAAIVFGLVFAVFDVREVVHQVDESRSGLVVIATVLAVLHLGIATLAAAGERQHLKGV